MTFFFQAFHNLYIAKFSKEETLFKKTHNNSTDKTKAPIPVKNHFVIEVSTFDQLKVFLSSKLPYCFKTNNHLKYFRLLYKKGQKKIERDFSVERVIKDLRDLKLSVKSQSTNPQLKLDIKYQKKNVIDLDQSGSDTSTDSQIEWGISG